MEAWDGGLDHVYLHQEPCLFCVEIDLVHLRTHSLLPWGSELRSLRSEHCGKFWVKCGHLSLLNCASARSLEFWSEIKCSLDWVWRCFIIIDFLSQENYIDLSSVLFEFIDWEDLFQICPFFELEKCTFESVPFSHAEVWALWVSQMTLLVWNTLDNTMLLNFFS